MGEDFVHIVDETTFGTGEPVSHWIGDLENEFGRIDLGRINSFIDGSAPNYLSVFDITKIKPTALQQTIALYALASLAAQ